MASSTAVWGIDIGQCALKALRCRSNPNDPKSIIAEAFDYIEYPKILSQPDSDPVELVADALKQFLSRNTVRGDRVAISVSGQSGLARFIKLPPVESKKIPDIVKYEARQQIPFPLDDVIWDYQQMAGGSESDGFTMETEVGLFAMKRDQVHRALKPFEDAGIEVDVIQLAPLAIYNYAIFDQMSELPPPDEYNPDDPPESMVLLSLGTDTSDLVVTNGYRVWQRSLPIGGSHFTKALTKELRLTFAKAEHLKKNATQAEDPKAVFQAMRPVFNDLVTEVQRSIAYFSGLDRKAKIGSVVALGNAMKLPGLQKYLSQNLNYSVAEVANYRGLEGAAVIGSPAFKENLLSFAVCYGLTLQGMGISALRTNLLPRELLTQRMVRAKKPWIVGVAATLLLACTVSYAGYYGSYSSVNKSGFASAFSAAQDVAKKYQDNKTSFEAAQNRFNTIKSVGENIVHNSDGALVWLEVLKAINDSLPRDPSDKHPDDLELRRDIHIEEIKCEWSSDVAAWYNQAKPIHDAAIRKPSAATTAVVAPTTDQPESTDAGGDAADAAPPPAATDAAAPAEAEAAPTGEGWIVQLRGYHFHNGRKAQQTGEGETAEFVRRTFFKHLEEGSVMLPGPNGELQEVKIKQLGISMPVLVNPEKAVEVDVIDGDIERMASDSTSRPRPGEAAAKRPTDTSAPAAVKKRKFSFVAQFLWQVTPLSKRVEKADQKSSATPEETTTARN